MSELVRAMKWSSYVVNRRQVELEGERRRGFGQVALLLVGVELILVRRAGILGDELVHGCGCRERELEEETR